MSLQHQHSSRYRPEIDGLRALAVLTVILFHFGLESFAGGFVGVDVFFVISGYLITQKLLAAHDRGGISFREFYASRIRRLLPALYSTLLLVALAAVFLMPLELRRLGASVVAALAWVANVFFWSEAGYWDPGWQTKPLLHTWSLSVEEQFYLVWPAFTALALRLGSRRGLYAALAIAGAASLVAAEWMVRRNPETAFFWMPFRVSEFVIGGLCVASDSPRWLRFAASRPVLREALSSTGLLLVVAAVGLFDAATRFPGLAAMIPCLGTGLVIVARRAPLSGFLLARPLSVQVGLLSYSLYLTHWPLLVFFHRSTDRLPEPVEVAALLLATLALSFLLFRFVETPLRQSARLGAGSPSPRIRPALLVAGVPALGLAMLGGLLVLSDGLAFRHRDEMRAIAAMTRAEVRAARRARMKDLCGDTSSLRCGSFDPTRTNVVILGDSNGPDALNVLATAYPEVNFLLWWQGGCPPLVGSLEGIGHAEPQCAVTNAGRWGDLRALPRVDAVVLTLNVPEPREPALKKTIEFLSQRGHRVHLLGPGPHFRFDLQRIALEHGSLIGLDEAADRHAVRSQYAVDDRLARFVESLGGTYVSKRRFFCPDGRPCRAVTKSAETLLLFDRQHLSAEGAAEFGLDVRRRYPDLFAERRHSPAPTISGP